MATEGEGKLGKAKEGKGTLMTRLRPFLRVFLVVAFRSLPLPSVAFLSSSLAWGAEVRVTISGKYFGVIDAYRVGDRYYLNAKDAGKLYDGRVYWYPVTGRVQMSLRGTQAQFLVNAGEAKIGGKSVKLPAEVIARASNAFIPLEFFQSPEFSDLASADTQFRPETGILTVDRRTTVGPLKWYTNQDYTQVVLEFDPKLAWSVARQGRSAFSISIPLGRIDWPEDVKVGDGLVSSMRLTQDRRAVKLAVRLEDKSVKWEARESKSPRRILMDVYRNAEAMKSGMREASDSLRAAASAGAGEVHGGGKPSMKAPVMDKPALTEAKQASAPSDRPIPLMKADRRLRIVVDAGHGGKDSGALGRHRTKEKDLNLAAAMELASLLKDRKLFDVLLVRDRDVFVPLDERSQKANNYNADLFVSIHCNAASSKTENGFEIYFLSERASDPESQRVADVENSVLKLEGKSEEDMDAAGVLHAMARAEFINEASELAGLVGKSLAARVDLHNRGVKQAAFYVLRGTNAPAVLIELGFVTNSKDESKLESKRFRRRLVEGVFSGILDYANRHGWKTEP